MVERWGTLIAAYNEALPGLEQQGWMLHRLLEAATQPTPEQDERLHRLLRELVARLDAQAEALARVEQGVAGMVGSVGEVGG